MRKLRHRQVMLSALTFVLLITNGSSKHHFLIFCSDRRLPRRVGILFYKVHMTSRRVDILFYKVHMTSRRVLFAFGAGLAARTFILLEPLFLRFEPFVKKRTFQFAPVIQHNKAPLFREVPSWSEFPAVAGDAGGKRTFSDFRH